MNNLDFENIVDATALRIQELSATKGHEYSGDVDRLLNFKRNAQNLGLCSTTIWAVYAAKHFDAIMTYCRDKEKMQERQLSEPIGGRIDDLILYLLLLKGLILDAEKAARE
jgi:hypothetical protein